VVLRVPARGQKHAGTILTPEQEHSTREDHAGIEVKSLASRNIPTLKLAKYLGAKEVAEAWRRSRALKASCCIRTSCGASRLKSMPCRCRRSNSLGYRLVALWQFCLQTASPILCGSQVGYQGPQKATESKAPASFVKSVNIEECGDQVGFP
jgi:hypothetical protein